MRDNLSIRSRLENVSSVLELLLHLSIVLNNPVLSNGNFSFTVKMRMSINLQGRAMSRPPDVTQSNLAWQNIQPIASMNLIDLPLILLKVNDALMNSRSTNRIVASMLKPLQSFMDHRTSLSIFENATKYSDQTFPPLPLQLNNRLSIH